MRIAIMRFRRNIFHAVCFLLVLSDTIGGLCGFCNAWSNVVVNNNNNNNKNNNNPERLHSRSSQQSTVCTASASTSDVAITFDDDTSAKKYKPLLDAIQQAKLDDHNPHRVFHGRGGMFEGCEHLTLDIFPPVCLLTSHLIELNPDELEELGNALESRWLNIMSEKKDGDGTSDNDNDNDDDDNENQNLNWIYQHRPDGSNPATTTLMSGNVPSRHIITENGMKFQVRLLHAQNHGLFLDMANGRDWVKQNSLGKNVLNLFSYTCGFSIAALLGGATEVVNVDMAKGALKVGQQNHDLNGLQQQGGGGGARFLPHDIFKSWGKIRKSGPYDIIIADPPSFQRDSFVAKKDYAKLVRRFPDLLKPEGMVVLCLNAPELNSTWLRDIVSEEAPSLEFVQRLENPSTFPSKDNERSLKVLIYRKRNDPEEKKFNSSD